MQWTPVVCLIAVLEYLFFTSRVGAARVRLEVPAPATTGNEEFERYFRVQQNTLEQLVVFLPAALGFAWFLSDVAAAGLGAVWIVGRALYFRGYVLDPRRRAVGMILTFGSNVVLVLGALGAAVWGLVRTAGS
ncbi:MAG: MAPEG family protein [Thermoanaerobaculia bacterium]|nr:MAPEG family protein [Thermoanaerobaculia bacterium]